MLVLQKRFMARMGGLGRRTLEDKVAPGRQWMWAPSEVGVCATMSSLARREAIRARIASIDSSSPLPPPNPLHAPPASPILWPGEMSGDGNDPLSSDQMTRDKLKKSKPPSTVSQNLTDSFGRGHDYLRISLTEKCNLRCKYCMPETGIPEHLLHKKYETLTPEEIERLARMFVKEGVKKIRLTGGEPTIRKELPEIVERLSSLRPLGLRSISMTTNGISLKRKLPDLRRAGLDGINVSLDSRREARWEGMTRRKGLSAVLSSLDTALSITDPSPFESVKLNVVVMKGVNDDECEELVEWGTKDKRLEVRFIEFMPFEDNSWSTSYLLPSSELLSRLQSRYPNIVTLPTPPTSTTRSYQVPGYKGNFGFISSMTDHFCAGCNRLRIGAGGEMKACLFGASVLSLRPLLRALPEGASDRDLSAQIMPFVGHALKGKKFHHDGHATPEILNEKGKMGMMVAIGG